MGLDSRLKKNIDDIKKKKDLKNADTSEELDVDEETYTYMQKKPSAYINEGKGVFDIKQQTGINSDKSIFDKKAIFRTDEGDY